MPSNLYGKNDNYDPKNSHVIPGLIHKFHVAKKNKDNFVTVWGTEALEGNSHLLMILLMHVCF